jgi:hypothetical protein
MPRKLVTTRPVRITVPEQVNLRIGEDIRAALSAYREDKEKELQQIAIGHKITWTDAMRTLILDALRERGYLPQIETADGL